MVDQLIWEGEVEPDLAVEHGLAVLLSVMPMICTVGILVGLASPVLAARRTLLLALLPAEPRREASSACEVVEEASEDLSEDLSADLLCAGGEGGGDAALGPAPARGVAVKAGASVIVAGGVIVEGAIVVCLLGAFSLA